MKANETHSKEDPQTITSNRNPQSNARDRTVKAREFRKDQIFRIVNEYQRSRQIVNMVQALDGIKDFWDTNATLSEKAEFEKYYSNIEIAQIRKLLIGLDHINPHNFSAKMFMEEEQ